MTLNSQLTTAAVAGVVISLILIAIGFLSLQGMIFGVGIIGFFISLLLCAGCEAGKGHVQETFNESHVYHHAVIHEHKHLPRTKMIICGNCGARRPEDQTFCPFCGSPNVK